MKMSYTPTASQRLDLQRQVVGGFLSEKLSSLSATCRPAIDRVEAIPVVSDWEHQFYALATGDEEAQSRFLERFSEDVLRRVVFDGERLYERPQEFTEADFLCAFRAVGVSERALIVSLSFTNEGNPWHWATEAIGSVADPVRGEFIGCNDRIGGAQ